ncbi:hypothetical protein C9374_012117 [Naegleria lovaniensis]|uniref:F-box domain-containing protein n=1 Tax=Naegleria lovaniensis TaxID=51637 RepID=A0AA88GDN3_NAELO|nr:uncharacterized protein C9374_012117 [Naegleria lovaniensis]KAG2373510.1 hypothetical protein C9374_012117 [Naegleria lovaniensis]
MLQHDELFADDMLFHIFQYVEDRSLIVVCRLVSKQWYGKVMEMPLNLDFSKSRLRPRVDHHSLLLEQEEEISETGSTMTKQQPSTELREAETISEATRIYSILSPPISNITCLNLSNNLLGQDQLNTLASCENLKNLKSLDLSANDFSRNSSSSSSSCSAIFSLVWSKFMSNLTSLNVNATTLEDEGIIAIAASPVMSNLRELYVQTNSLTRASVEAIGNSKTLTNLTILDLAYNKIQACDVECLTQSSNMKNLTLLDLSHNAVRLVGARCIASSKYLNNIRTLNLANAIDDEGVKVLITSHSMSNLTQLNLEGVYSPRITPKHPFPMFASSVFNSSLTHLSIQIRFVVPKAFMKDITVLHNLQYLKLSFSPIDIDGAKELAAHESSKRLKTLHLICCKISEEAGALLMQSPHLVNLTSLNLSGNQLDGTLLFNSSMYTTNHFEKLTSLDLSSNGIKSDGAVLMSQCSRLLRNVKELNLNYNTINDQGLSALASCKYLSNLTILKLSSNGIGDYGIASLCESEHLKHLTHLNLFANSQIYSEGAISIANSVNMKNLTCLRLNNCNIGSKGAVALASSELMQNLTGLHVSCNCISSTGALAIVSSKYLTKLQELDMQGNVFGGNTYEEIATRLSTFKYLTTVVIQRQRHFI